MMKESLKYKSMKKSQIYILKYSLSMVTFWAEVKPYSSLRKRGESCPIMIVTNNPLLRFVIYSNTFHAFTIGPEP